MLPILCAAKYDDSSGSDTGGGSGHRIGHNERRKSEYETISGRFDSGIGYGSRGGGGGSGGCDYPIKEDETTAYCTSKHPNINFFFYTSFYIVFLIFGAIVFMIIEQPGEIQARENLIRHQEAFLAKYTNVEARDLHTLLRVVLEAQSNGYYVPIVGHDLILDSPVFAVRTRRSVPTNKIEAHPSTYQSVSSPDVTPTYTESNFVNDENVGDKNDRQQDQSTTIRDYKEKNDEMNKIKPTIDTSNFIGLNNNDIRKNNEQLKRPNRLTSIKFTYNWRFSSSLLFVTSLVTTIGYGNLTPLTTVGKTVCILFCIVGVPATLVFLSTLVTLFVRGPVKRIEAWIIRAILSLHRTASLFLVRMIHLTIITSILVCVCLIIPAYMFYIMEDDWTYLDAFYCCFISLTTIGLGDFVPGINNFVADLLYPLGIIFYLFFGLAMIMLWLALIHRIPQLQLGDALVSDEKEEENRKEEENQRARERLRVLTNQIILQDKLKKMANLQSIIVHKS